MPRGFFFESELVGKEPPSAIPKCGACGLYKACKSPKMEPTGRGNKKILVIAESPGPEEDEEGRQLVGNSGRELRDAMKRTMGVNLQKDCVLTSAIICRPKNGPSPDQIEWCRPNLLKTIEAVKPELIIPLGYAAVRALIGHLWKEDIGNISRWIGWQIPDQLLNAWVTPTFHPAYVLRSRDDVIRQLFESHLESAAELLGTRPYPNGPPNYNSEIETITSPTKAARLLRKMAANPAPISFDYEVNMLKPDHPDAIIISAAVCWKGKKTIAFPFIGDAVDAWRELMSSDCPKIAHPIKFEDRWTRARARVKPRKWAWCTQTAAHILDNRRGITGLKFQSYARLGFPNYNDRVDKFIRGKGSMAANNLLKQVSLEDLLLYNGLDALLTYKLAELQTKDAGLYERVLQC